MVSETLNKGLRNVYLDRTESSFIDGEQGILLYRGYNIHDLATQSSFEEVCYLLIHGDMPTQEELGAFDRRLRRQRSIPNEVIETIRLNQRAHPMDVLRTGVSSLASFDADTADMSRAANVRKMVGSCSLSSPGASRTFP
jgi:citrate synthase